MKSFSYKGKMISGKTISGDLEAANEIEARVKLRAQKIIPIKVSEKGKTSDFGREVFEFLGLEPKAKSKDLQVFTRQFATLINSGVPIVQSLDILTQQTTSPVLKKVLQSVKTNVENGKRLGDSMDGWPKVFDRLYMSLVRAGEEGGVLDTILNRLAAYIEKSVKLKNKVVGALWYPAGIMVVAVAVIAVLLVYVIPKFEAIFKSANQELPTPTQIVIEVSHFLQAHLIGMILSLFFSIVALNRFYATKRGRRLFDAIFIQIPIFGTLIQKAGIARFSRTMSTMLSSGVGILDSLEISSNVVGNNVLEVAILRAKTAISEGKSIAQPLSREPFIPPMVSQMIGIGETTGALDTMFGKIADFYEEEVDAAVDAMTSIMEPLMMVILGTIIAGLVIAMYLPIFQLAGAAGK